MSGQSFRQLTAAVAQQAPLLIVEIELWFIKSSKGSRFEARVIHAREVGAMTNVHIFNVLPAIPETFDGEENTATVQDVNE